MSRLMSLFVLLYIFVIPLVSAPYWCLTRLGTLYDIYEHGYPFDLVTINCEDLDEN